MDKDFNEVSLWDENQTLPVLRPPRKLTKPQPTSGATDNAVVGGGDIPVPLPQSTLSVDAKEFVPRITHSNVSPAAKEFVPKNACSNQSSAASSTTSYVSTGSSHSNRKPSHQEPVRLVNGTETTNQQTSNTCIAPQNDADQSDFTQNVVKRYNEYMQEIIVKPGRFDALARMLLDESISWFGYSQVAYAVVDAIVSQAIVERNFQYNGARLCSLLSAELDTDVPVFKNHLFDRIKAEYDKVVPDVGKYPSKSYGLVGFLAELYTQMGGADNSNNLGEYFLNIVDGLVSSFCPENIKRVCQLLKLTGGMLDKENKPKMDAIIEKLGAAGFETNTTHLVGSVLSLRYQKWGEETGANPADAVIDSSLAGLPCLQSEAVQYGPDGITLSKEESDFLHESFQAANDTSTGEDTEDADDFGDEYTSFEDDEMDEEIEQGYLEFLIESKQII